MKILKVLLISLLLINQRIMIGSEESDSSDSDGFGFSGWIKKPPINFLITGEQIELNAAFHLGRISNTFTGEARDALVADMPLLDDFIDQNDTKFRDALCAQTVALVQQKSIILAEDLEPKYYRQRRSKIKQVDLAATEYPCLEYLRSRESGDLYQMDPELAGVAVLHDQKKAIDELNTQLLLIENATSTALQQTCNTGLARRVLAKCAGNPHAFHAGCIKQALKYKSQCPTCLTAAGKKDLRFDPKYKKGESCDICLEEIKPSSVAAAAGAEVITAGAMAGAGGASAGASASAGTSASASPIRIRQRKTGDYQDGSRSAEPSRGRRFRHDEREDLA